MTDALKTRIAETISSNRIVLFMKGNPSMPQCGFSAAVVGILKEVGVPFGSYNILADQELREGLKDLLELAHVSPALRRRAAGRGLRHRPRDARQGRAGAAAAELTATFHPRAAFSDDTLNGCSAKVSRREP